MDSGKKSAEKPQSRVYKPAGKRQSPKEAEEPSDEAPPDSQSHKRKAEPATGPGKKAKVELGNPGGGEQVSIARGDEEIRRSPKSSYRIMITGGGRFAEYKKV